MSTRSKILSISLLILLAAAGFFIFKDKLIPLKKELGIGQTDLSQTDKKIDEEIIVTSTNKETDLKQELQLKASLFAERFGSYSNQNNYENVTELTPLMTSAMKKWADNFVKKAKAERISNQPYQGFSIKALKSVIESSNSQQAVVKVNCQRQESADNLSENKISYSQAKIIFIQENGEWKVNEFKWE